MGITSKAKELFAADRTHSLFLITIIIIGLYFRLYMYGVGGGLIGDSPLTVAGGVKWFYPHDYFPGLVQIFPPVGNYLIGAGCMMSGQDFSGIAQLPPNFAPPIAYLIGEAFSKAENYCLMPLYLSGILVFLGLIILSYFLLDKYSAMYASAFFATYPLLLKYGRTIIIDGVFWVFLVFGFIFLWKAYVSKINSMNELYFFVISSAILGLGTSAKFTGGVYFILLLFLAIEKYNFSIIRGISNIPKLNLGHILHIEKIGDDKTEKIALSIKLLIASGLSYITFVLLPFGLNPKNLIELQKTFFYWYPNYSDVAPSLNFFKTAYIFLYNINIFDAILLLFSIVVFYKILVKLVNGTAAPNEKFIMYGFLTSMLTVSFSINIFNGMWFSRREIPFFFFATLMAATAFSNKDYSIFNLLWVPENKRKTAFYVFISVYLLIGASALYETAPHYELIKNKVLCSSSEKDVCYAYLWNEEKYVSEELKSVLKENETYYVMPTTYTPLYLYIRPHDEYAFWQISTALEKQKGSSPSAMEIINAYNNVSFEGRRVKYLVAHIFEKSSPIAIHDEETKMLLKNYLPYRTVTLNGKPIAAIYDLENMELK